MHKKFNKRFNKIITTLTTNTEVVEGGLQRLNDFGAKSAAKVLKEFLKPIYACKKLKIKTLNDLRSFKDLLPDNEAFAHHSEAMHTLGCDKKLESAMQKINDLYSDIEDIEVAWAQLEAEAEAEAEEEEEEEEE